MEPKNKFLLIIIFVMPLSILVFLFQYQIIKVESASMERTLKNGDVILVKKIRQKKDKNQNDINKQLRDRIVVFNNPSREGMLFVKRCIAISGDTLTLNNHEFYRNGKKLVNCDKILNRYYVKTHDFDLFNQHVDGSRLSIIKTSSEYFIVDTNLEILRSLVSDSIISIFSDPLLKGKLFNNVENTLIIPQKNDKLTELCKNTFGELFFQLEISNKLIRHNYCFVIGDNRGVSLDSRHWGLLPVSNIVGIATIVLYSRDKYSLGSKIRISRFFQRV